MLYRHYNKPYQSPEDLIAHMKQKNLIVSDENSAKQFLDNVNYYRFKVYLWPFLDDEQTSYIQGSTFEQGVELYRFDEELRNYLFSVIGRVEIKLRSKLDQIVTPHVGDPCWYLDDVHFIRAKKGKMNGVRASLASSFQQSKNEFAIHYKSNYYNTTSDDFKQLPPFWMISELATFGQIMTIYDALDKPSFQGTQNSNKLNDLAYEFGARNFAQLNNWITAIRNVRNRCAHHSRIWNATHRQGQGIVGLLTRDYRPTNDNKIYSFCVLLNQIDHSLSMGLGVKDHLRELFSKYPTAEDKSYSAGFPSNWFLDPVWG